MNHPATSNVCGNFDAGARRSSASPALRRSPCSRLLIVRVDAVRLNTCRAGPGRKAMKAPVPINHNPAATLPSKPNSSINELCHRRECLHRGRFPNVGFCFSPPPSGRRAAGPGAAARGDVRQARWPAFLLGANLSASPPCHMRNPPLPFRPFALWRYVRGGGFSFLGSVSCVSNKGAQAA